MMYFIAIFIVILAITIYNYQFITIDELDLISYILAKSSLATFPKTYPKNETARINTIRSVMKYNLQYGFKPFNFLLNPSLMRIPYEDVFIPVDDAKDEILLRLYNTEKSLKPDEKPKKVLIFYHGGGWIFFSAEDLHPVTLQIAQSSDYLVVSVDYRLAPEHIFPTAINDAYTALQWVINNIANYGGDPSSIIVSGESAGGNLAAAVTSRHLHNKIESHCSFKVRLHDPDQMLCRKLFDKEQKKEKWHEIVGLWLVYPVLNATSSSPNAKKYANVNGFLTMDEMEWMRRLYQGSDDYNEKIRTNYQYSPLYTPNLIVSVYPPTLFIFAEHDILTAEGLEFAGRLRDYLRSVHMMTFSSTVHAFLAAHPFLGPKAIAYSTYYFKQLLRD